MAAVTRHTTNAAVHSSFGAAKKELNALLIDAGRLKSEQSGYENVEIERNRRIRRNDSYCTIAQMTLFSFALQQQGKR